MLPIPDEVYWTWIIWGVSVNYVWYIGDNISRLIRLNKAPKDNLTNNKYLYWVSWDFSKFQLATTMEQLQINSIISKAHANYWSVKILWNYNYPLKLWNKLYSLPSLIFLWNEITSTWFLIDWWKNTINIKENNNQTISEILEKITWSWGLTLTWIIIPELSIKDFKNSSWIPKELSNIWIKDKDYLWQIIYWDKYFSDSEYNISKKLICPEGFIKVPWDNTNTFKYSDWTTTNDFCVAKYEMWYLDNILPNTTVWWNTWNTVKYDINKNPISRAWIYPVTEITQQQAIDSCKKMWDWFHLITNNEWMTIARNIENVSSNWSTNKIWEGFIYNWVSGNITMWCNSTWWNSESRLYATKTGPWNEECNFKRKHVLSNWSEIWDLVWNIREHVNKSNTINWDNYNLWLTKIEWCNKVGLSDFIDCLDKTNWPFWIFNSLNWVGQFYYIELLTDNIFIRWWAANTMSNWAWIYSLAIDHSFISFNSSMWFRCSYKK